MPNKSISFLLMKVLLSAGRAFVLPKIPSKTLQKALTKINRGKKGYLNVPHYWAVYYHEGHKKPIVPRFKKFLVWFKNPSNDPRLAGGYPVRSPARRLTKEEFVDAQEKGQIIVTKRSPFDGRLVRGRNFFANKGGMLGFSVIADEAIRKTLPGILHKEFARRGLLNITIKKTVNIK